ncbi:MAG: GC-type dockerin domain-anchored protein [Phycisphaerales bacterium]|nr:GC-type dockerin domain-anchored protein [Phycisphaerales bacterium]
MRHALTPACLCVAACALSSQSASAQPATYLLANPPARLEPVAISPNGRFITGTGGLVNPTQFYVDLQASGRPIVLLPVPPNAVGAFWWWSPAAVSNAGLIAGSMGSHSTDPNPNAVKAVAINPAISNTFAVLTPAGAVSRYSPVAPIGNAGYFAGEAIGSGPTEGGRIYLVPGQAPTFASLGGLRRTLTAGRTAAGEDVIIGIDDQNRVLRVNAFSGVATVITTVPFEITCASGDGTTLAGYNGGGPQRWRADTGVQPLGTLSLAFVIPSAMSNDGATIVGNGKHSPFGAYNSGGIVWREGVPPADLWSLVPEPVAGVNVTGGTWITAISADGSTLTGYVSPSATYNDSLPYAAVIPPGRGNTCASPTPVTYGTTFASTRGATRSASPAFGCTLNEGAAPDIFFSFVPVASETVTIDTCGSDFDTTLQVTTSPGGCGSGGTLVSGGCNDDDATCSANTAASRVSVNVFSGQTYWIRVSGWNNNKGAVQLNITAPNRPVNDLCSGAIEVPPGTARAVVATNAITDTSPPNCSGGFTLFQDVWFTSTAPADGTMTFSTCGAPGTQATNIYNLSACGTNQPPIACGVGGCSAGGGYATVSCTQGQRFLIRVGGLFGATPSGTFTSTFTCNIPNGDVYSSSVMVDNPLGFWRFNDGRSNTAADYKRTSGALGFCGDHPGTYFGNPSLITDGLWGTAMNLTGGVSGVNGISVTAPGTTSCGIFGAFSLEAWVRTTNTSAGVVMTQRGAPLDQSLTMVVGYSPLGNQPGKAMFVLDGPGVFTGAISTSNVADGRWHHIVGTRSYFVTGGGWNYSIFVDGQLQGNNNLIGVGSRAPTGVNAANGWSIGYAPAWNVGYAGQIDEAALYCTALLPNRISQHYNDGDRRCNAADIGQSGGAPGADGAVDNNDFIVFIDYFFNGNPLADVGSQGGVAGPDGLFNNNDFVVFINQFFTPCW